MTHVLTRDGTAIYSKCWGWGRPVVLLHGWPLTADSWDPIATILANAGFRVVSYDRRGFGRSDQPSHGYDYDTLSDDLAEVMAFHRVTDDAALIGFSMGGGEVVRYMSRHNRGVVSQIALISSVAPGLIQTDDNLDGVAPEIFVDMEKQLVDDRAHFYTRFFKQFYGVGLIDRPVSQEVLDHARAMAMQAGLLPTLAAMRAFSHTDFTADLGAIDVPTLLIHGTADDIVPMRATSQRVADAVGMAGLVEYGGAPHGLFATRQDDLANDLIAFLRHRLAPIRSVAEQAALDVATANAVVAPSI
ncbi:alpha/beta fold hydrolase [Novosphingobium sp. KACC 22771]|uniref:alpha/beta fold hydrolase n=1 Tax=Novosphingobium sp. KACC 22771 TaxID=3025670 RepID=UPI002366EF3D|nr:alpha/beta hydrolase [Novosphingobium sp. KACC 22771]WDF73107.1 alpha/beta hydrolase [Novosphingobium sp. KACC 22771]